MYGRTGAALAGLLLVLFAAGESMAQRVYRVEAIPVDVEADSASAARDLALAAGQRRAFERLIARLVVESEQERLPALGDQAIFDLVRGIEVADEKTSSTRYLAALTVSFKRGQVRDLLRRHGLRFSETPGRAVLVLPVLERRGITYLWDDFNPWRDAWRQRPKREALVPVVLPIGDLEDVTLISADEAISADPEALARIMGRYDVSDLLIAFASLKVDPSDQRFRMEISLTRSGPSGQSVLVESVLAEPGETLDQFLPRAATAVAGEIEQSWKLATLLRFDQEARLSATVPVSGMRHWIDVQKRLSGVAVVRGVELDALNRRRAQIVIHYLGDPEQLKVSLSNVGLNLNDIDGFWVLIEARKGGE